MRKAEFEVPVEVLSEFAKELVESELENSITGVNRSGEIVIEVLYKRNEIEAVNELEEFLEELLEEDDEDDEDED